MKRKYELTHIAIRYFDTQMDYRRAIMKSRIEKTKNESLNLMERAWEREYKRDMSERQAQGNASVKNIK